jgi:hypothetical protein
LTTIFFWVIILSDFHGHSWFLEFSLRTFKTVFCFTFSAILKNCLSGRFATVANSGYSYFAIFIKQFATFRCDVISIVILYGTLIHYLNISLLRFNLLSYALRIVLCFLSSYVELFLLLDIWLLTWHINK